MNRLTKEDILRYFEMINKALAKRNQTGEIIVAGGAALALAFDARNSTYDIDAIFEPKSDMQKIIKEVAQANDLDDDWLNDGVKGFMNNTMDATVCLNLSHLVVKNLDAKSLLAMKLTSARPEPSMDMKDSIFLMEKLNIKAESELFAIIEKYTHPSRHTMQSKYFTKTAFEKYQRRKLSLCEQLEIGKQKVKEQDKRNPPRKSRDGYEW